MALIHGINDQNAKVADAHTHTHTHTHTHYQHKHSIPADVMQTIKQYQ